MNPVAVRSFNNLVASRTDDSSYYKYLIFYSVSSYLAPVNHPSLFHSKQFSQTSQKYSIWVSKKDGYELYNILGCNAYRRFKIGSLFIEITTGHLFVIGGIRKGSWFRHYATSRNASGSIPDVIGFFNWPNPSSRTMNLGSNQPLTEMSIRNIPWSDVWVVGS
jgi:hypothetical protein